MTNERCPDHPIEAMFLNRWSPRAYDATSMPAADLLIILEAARWAPSAYNIQPWRFLYSHRDDVHWQLYLSLLDEFNTSWALHASALVVVLSDTMVPGVDNGEPKLSGTHSFDAGAAWAQLALQATSLGYHAHAMAGIHFDQVRKSLAAPEQFSIEIVVAIGRRADPSMLPKEFGCREQPSQRMPLNDIAFSGSFSS